MGFFSCFGGKTEKDRDEEDPYHHPVLSAAGRRHNNYYYPLHNGDYSSSSTTTSFERLRKVLLSFPKLLYNASKMVWQKLLTIFHRPRKPAANDHHEPILPVKTPAPRLISNHDPLLVQTRLISSPSMDIHADDQEEEFQNDNSVVVDLAQPRNDPRDIPQIIEDAIFALPDDMYLSVIAHPYTRVEMMDYTVTLIEPLDDFLDSPSTSECKEENTQEKKKKKKKKNKKSEKEPLDDFPDSPSTSECKEENTQEKKKKKKKKNKKSEKEESSVMSVVVDEGIRWITHYSNRDWILIVGDEDFSFSACLAVAFGSSASNIIATSLDSKGILSAFLKKNYQNFVSNMKELRSRGCQVMHGIDATKLASHELLGHRKFDRIIYNFPFAGFFGGMPTKSQICLHRELVSEFLKNAKEMITVNGEIHISHKTNGRFHQEWKFKDLASSHGLRLIEAVQFNSHDYPGYNTNCVFGGDNNFDCNPSKTYKFGLKVGY